MTYTKRMHDALRRDTSGKHNQVTDLLDEIEELQKEILELKKIKSADFWSNWIYPDGANPEQIQDELNDYHTFIGETAKVYDHITGGRISKVNTLAYEVISVADDCYREIYEEEYKEEILELKKQINLDDPHTTFLDESPIYHCSNIPPLV